MRKFLFAFAAAVAVISVTTWAAPRADATPVGAAIGIQAALQGASLLEEAAVVCRHRYRSSRRVCRNVLVCRHRYYSSRRYCY
jgi:hypothetical protein